MHPRGSISEVDESVPEGQAILSAGYGDEYVLLRREHSFLLDGAAKLPLKDENEALAAEGGVVMSHLNFGLCPAPFAFHESSPVEPQSWPRPRRAGKSLPTGDDVADLNLIVRFEHLLLGDKLVTANDHDRARHEIERLQNLTDALASGELETLAGR